MAKVREGMVARVRSQEEKTRIEEWLAICQEAAELARARVKSVKGWREIGQLVGQVQYWEHAISTIKWLRGLNRQQRKIEAPDHAKSEPKSKTTSRRRGSKGVSER